MYRVLDLPHSIRPLVYDFGQLKKGAEDVYIEQIVRDYVNKHRSLKSESVAVIPVITGVLTTSQSYMREKKVLSFTNTIFCRQVLQYIVIFRTSAVL